MVKGSKVKERSNDKSNSVNALALDKNAKVSTLTSSSDIRLRAQMSNKGQIDAYITHKS